MSINCQLKRENFSTLELIIGNNSYEEEDKCKIVIAFDIESIFYENKLNELDDIQKVKKTLENIVSKIINAKIKKASVKIEEIEWYDEYAAEIKKYSNKVINYLWCKEKDSFNTSFNTGESLTLHLKGTTESENKDLTEPFEEYELNLMLEAYPVFWNQKDDARNHFNSSCFINTDYAFYITEISKFDSESWKLEIALTNADERRYYSGGRFKFIVKTNDILKFRYFENSDDYVVSAKIQEITNNKITFNFENGINKLFIKDKDCIWDFNNGWY